MRLTVGQAVVRFLLAQHAERDGRRARFFEGVFGIFGHGNVAGLGAALLEHPELPYVPARNEQAMVHAAAGFARMRNRLATYACTTSIGPGATNMVTAAAGATINRIPVLLLPGDIFARRDVGPVLQQLEDPRTPDVSVNDCFKPVSRYWDRISRPEQLITSLPEAMRVLTSPADTGAVTLCLPQDVQALAHEFPEALFTERVWHVPRARPDRAALARAIEAIRAAKRPLIVAGGGVIYSEATKALRRLCEETGIPVAETQAGKGSLPYDHPLCLGAVGATGTRGANLMAREADVVFGIGTRYSDFTTASKTLFQDPGVRFVNLNVTEFDAFKHSGVALVADAREGLEELLAGLDGWTCDDSWRSRARQHNLAWDALVTEHYAASGGKLRQAEVIGAVDEVSEPTDVVVCAAGSLPGDLHKLWRARDPKGYHLEYGYSCMGYEVAGGLGVKLADPSREVWVMVGDASWLMMSSEIVTAIQEGVKLNVVLLDNHGFASIGGLSGAVGCQGFGTHQPVRVDYAANARSLGADVLEASARGALVQALRQSRASSRTTVTVVETDREARVPGYEAWWDVPVAEVSGVESVREARTAYEQAVKAERHYL